MMNTDTIHTFVDLGLSVKWATTNVGAASETEGGAYYGWGTLEPQNNQNTCFYYNGMLDHGHLPMSQDVARQCWGGEWRIPTEAEWQELLNEENCLWTWDEEKRGYTVQSKKPGYTDRSIFLPAAGMLSYGGTYNAGNYGYYWTSDFYDQYRARFVLFEKSFKLVGDHARVYGDAIRPVCE